MNEFNVVSLFDGISCCQVALNRAGISYDNYFASEIDKNAIKVTNTNYPKTIQLGDINEWESWKLPKIQLLTAGSPCQGFSFCGKQLNFNDPRSSLFFKFVDILNFLKPKYFLLENVKMKKEYLDVISTSLGVNCVFINSSLLSAQNRQRYYWTNIPIPPITDSGITLQSILDSGFATREKQYCVMASDRPSNRISYKKRYLERHIGICKAKELKESYSPDDLEILTPEEAEKLQTLPVGFTKSIPTAARYKAIGNGWTVDVIAHILQQIKKDNK